MSQTGSESIPLRVAIVGSGPAGFYTAEHLLKSSDVSVQVDMFDRLPTPYGLVRFGVAPDHEKIKNVTRVFDKVAAKSTFRFYGNVDVGMHCALDDLRRFYHQICFATGAQTDRQLGVPGEELERSHAATEFVAWYNGHPDFRHCTFDLSVERAAVIGVGNVAVDVARILCRTPEELAVTDIADYALDALRESRVKEVYMLGRRGPAQAAFTNPEVRELGEMPGSDIAVRKDEVALDPLTAEDVAKRADRTLDKKLEILSQFAERSRTGKPRLLTIRFLVSPVEVLGDEQGKVTGLRLVKNELYRSANGSLRSRPTEQFEELPVELVFRSVGYRGVPLPGLPFDDRSGIVPNDKGRVLDSAAGRPMQGVYVSGWIKRGPTGVIGTNKPDAAETVASMLEDLREGRILHPESPNPGDVHRYLCTTRPEFVSYDAWLHLKEIEESRGVPQGRPRVKLTTIEEMLAQLADRPRSE